MARSFFQPERLRFAEARKAVEDALGDTDVPTTDVWRKRRYRAPKDRWANPDVAYVAWEICASRGIIPMDWFVSREGANLYDGGHRIFATREMVFGRETLRRYVYPQTLTDVLTFASDAEGVALCEVLAHEAVARLNALNAVCRYDFRVLWITADSPDYGDAIVDLYGLQSMLPNLGYRFESQSALREGLSGHAVLEPLLRIFDLGYGIHRFARYGTVTLVAPRATKSGRPRR